MKKTKNIFYIILAVTGFAGASLFAGYWLRKNFYHSSGSYTYYNKSDLSAIEINQLGKITFTDDEQDIKSITPGGHFKLRQTSPLGSRQVHINASLTGTITRSYSVNDQAEAYATEGRAWLRQMMPGIIRSGAGAATRIDRLYRTAGIAGVTKAIDGLEDDRARTVYFDYLLVKPELTDDELIASLNHLIRTIDGAYEKKTLLSSIVGRYVRNGSIGPAYTAAAASIASDHEKGQLVTAVARHDALDQPRVAQLLTVTASIASDFTKSRVLLDLLDTQRLERANFARLVEVTSTIQSDFEKSRVVAGLINRTVELDETRYVAVLNLIRGIDSDFEKGKALATLLGRHKPNQKHYGPVLSTIATLSSDFEKAKQLASIGNGVARQQDKTLLEAYAKVARTIGSDFEYRQVMRKIE